MKIIIKPEDTGLNNYTCPRNCPIALGLRRKEILPFVGSREWDEYDFDWEGTYKIMRRGNICEKADELAKHISKNKIKKAIELNLETGNYEEI